MSEQIKPALTPGEWARFIRYGRDAKVGMRSGVWDERRNDAVAALALHGQPYGFTWDDVDALRAAAEASDLWEDPATWPDWPDPGLQVVPNRALSALADRIAALLPPREP